MVKVVVLYKQPEDSEAFDKYYYSTHIPLVEKVSGLVKTEISKFTSGVGGPAPYYLMAELYFNNEEEMNQALATPEARAMSKDVRNFAKPDAVTMAFAQVQG